MPPVDIRDRLKRSRGAGGNAPQEATETIGQDALAGILGISARQIRNLAANGTLTKSERGHYPWPKAVHEYCAFLRGGEQHNESAVRLRETKLRCQVLEQKIRDTKDAIIEETKAKDWQQVQDCLAAYRGELMRAAVTEPVRAVLNAAIARAVESVNAQAAKSISDGPREE